MSRAEGERKGDREKEVPNYCHTSHITYTPSELPQEGNER